MRYDFDCYTHGLFEVEAPIDTGPPDVIYCPQCHEESVRVWHAAPVRWDTDGAHGQKGSHFGDYNATGNKLEQLNRSWSKKYNEKPPPPAKDVPRNSRDPY